MDEKIIYNHLDDETNAELGAEARAERLEAKILNIRDSSTTSRAAIAEEVQNKNPNSGINAPKKLKDIIDKKFINNYLNHVEQINNLLKEIGDNYTSAYLKKEFLKATPKEKIRLTKVLQNQINDVFHHHNRDSKKLRVDGLMGKNTIAKLEEAINLRRGQKAVEETEQIISGIKLFQTNVNKINQSKFGIDIDITPQDKGNPSNTGFDFRINPKNYPLSYNKRLIAPHGSINLGENDKVSISIEYGNRKNTVSTDLDGLSNTDKISKLIIQNATALYKEEHR